MTSSSSAAGFRETFIKHGDNRRDVAPAIDQLEDRRGGLIEFGHTLRIEDRMALLGSFHCRSVAATKGNDGRFLHDYASRVVSQAALSVTV